jgi:UDP-glucose 4-epimerase
MADVLITGGAGYIGSSIASACEDAGLAPVIIDNLSTGRPEFVAERAFHRGDFADRDLLRAVFAAHPAIRGVIHCAALIDVAESVERPAAYYRENVAKTIELADELAALGCTRLIYSSSASVYQADTGLEVDESSPLRPSSPYARSKWIAETVLTDIAQASPLRTLSLRYFNPIGADPKLRSGMPSLTPTHVLGRLLSAGRSGEAFVINGTDWPTRDGTPVRDYIHVFDLAEAHVAALTRFDEAVGAGGAGAGAGVAVINLGTGRGTTVRELLAAFQAESGVQLTVLEGERRPGDVAGCVASFRTAHELLGWTPTRSIAQAIRDALDWLTTWRAQQEGAGRPT